MLQLDESQTALLKTWIIRKLEDVSDADSDVLADYVLALIKTDEPEAVARSNSIENLQDFLQDGATQFVDDVFAAIRSRSYDPSNAQGKPSQNKRRFGDLEDGNTGRHEGRNVSGRSVKHNGANKRIKANGRQGRHDRNINGNVGMPGLPFFPDMSKFPVMPNMPPNVQNFDPSNPIAAFLALQAAMGMFPGMPGLGGNHVEGAMPGVGLKERCWEYTEKGFCARGTACPYDHGDESVVIPFPEEYDPRNATITGDVHRTGAVQGRSRHTQNGGRSDFSLRGPNHDLTNSTIVIEKIPQTNLDEKQIDEFFSQFGEIARVEVKAESGLAVVEYKNHSAAKAAYESPKPIFDNRFVKVFWHRPSGTLKTVKFKRPLSAKHKTGHETVGVDHEADFDAEEFARRQQEAQRKHEEAKAQLEMTAKQKKLLDEQLSTMELERAKMADAIARKTGVGEPSAVNEFEKTQRLKEQLAKLEAEAISLGIDPKAEDTAGPNEEHGYRGRGGFRGRGRGMTAYRGARGAWQGPSGAVKRLDNRPKTLAITFENGDYEAHEEALRQYLLFGGGESASITKHPSRQDTALLEFAVRYQAENFMASAALAEIPHIGKAGFSWYRPDDSSTNSANTSAFISAGDKSSSHVQEGPAREEDTEYDMDDEVRWG